LGVPIIAGVLPGGVPLRRVSAKVIYKVDLLAGRRALVFIQELPVVLAGFGLDLRPGHAGIPKPPTAKGNGRPAGVDTQAMNVHAKKCQGDGLVRRRQPNVAGNERNIGQEWCQQNTRQCYEYTDGRSRLRLHTGIAFFCSNN